MKVSIRPSAWFGTGDSWRGRKEDMERCVGGRPIQQRGTTSEGIDTLAPGGGQIRGKKDGR